MKDLLKAALALVVAIPLSNCAAMRQQAAQEHVEQFNKQYETIMHARNEACTASMNIPDLDPIRDKVELINRSGVSAAPFAMLSNTSYPQGNEIPAIAKWATLRDDCVTNVKAALSTVALPAEINHVFWSKVMSFKYETGAHVSELVVALYQGKITYGDFAKKRTEIAAAGRNGEQEYRQAWADADYQKRMQASQLAEQHYATSVQAWANYMQTLQSIQPQRPAITTATCTRMGNTVNCMGTQQ